MFDLCFVSKQFKAYCRNKWGGGKKISTIHEKYIAGFSFPIFSVIGQAWPCAPINKILKNTHTNSRPYHLFSRLK